MVRYLTLFVMLFFATSAFGQSHYGPLQAQNNLSDLQSYSTAMSNLGAAPKLEQFQTPTTATNYVVTSSDCGTSIPFIASTNIAVELPDSGISQGCKIALIQMGVGTLHVVTASGAVLNGPNNQTSAQGSAIIVSPLLYNGNLNWFLRGSASYHNYNTFGTQAPVLPPTAPTPSLVYYVSPTGSDSNNGTSSSTPFQTIAHVNAMTNIPDNTEFLFQGGQSFTGCLAFVKGVNVPSTTAAGGIQLSSYGTGDATFVSNCPGTVNSTSSNGPQSSLINFNGINGVYISNVIANCNDTGTQYGILVDNTVDSTGVTNVTIKGNTAEGCNINAWTSAGYDPSADIGVQAYMAVGGCGGTITNVLVSGNTAQGLSVADYDDTGIRFRGCASGHTTETLQNITVSANTVTDIGGRAIHTSGQTGNGINFNGAQFAEAKFNVVSYGGANTEWCGGPGGIWDYDSDNINIHNNEVNHMQPTTDYQSRQNFGCDWLAYDLDGGTTNSVVQYNHSDFNFGNAWEFFISYGYNNINGWSNNTIRYNISEDDTAGDTTANTYDAYKDQLGAMSIGGGGGAEEGGPGTEAYFYNNTIINANVGNEAVCIDYANNTSNPTNSVIANNSCTLTGTEGTNPEYLYGGGGSPTGTNYLSNGYYATNGNTGFTAAAYNNPNNYGGYTGFTNWQAVAPGGEKGSTQASPLFSATPAPGACTITANQGPQPCPSQLTLGTGSTYKGVGADLTAFPYNLNIGKTDYYGNGIPNSVGSFYNIGAYGGP